MPAYYTKEKSKFGGVVGTIQVYTTTLSQDNNPENFKTDLPAGYLRCDGSILAASQYPLLAAILGTGSNSKFARDPDSLSSTEFQLPDLGSKYIRAANSSGGYLSDKVGNTTQYRAGAGLDVSVLGSTTKEVTYNGNLKVLAKNNIPFKGAPYYIGGDENFQTKSGLATSDTFQAHGHNTSKRAIFNYTGDWDQTAASEIQSSTGSTFGINSIQPEGANYLSNVDADPAWGFLSGDHKHYVTTPKAKTFNHSTASVPGNHNFNYNMGLQEIDPFGLTTSVNLSTSVVTKLDNVISPFIIVEYIIKF